MMSLLKTELFLQCFSDQSWRELCLHINSIVFLGTYLRSIFRELFFYEISVVYFCDSGYVLLFSEKKMSLRSKILDISVNINESET